MTNPKLSVCIPVYNGQSYLKKAIDSVLSQDFTDFELVILDNKSEDATLSIIKKYSDPRIKLIENDSNIGFVPNWNKALDTATGSYIKILPADDYLYPGSLKKQCAILDEDLQKEISLVASRRDIINQNGKILFNRGFARRAKKIDGHSAISKNIKSGGNIIGEAGSLMFRREIIKQAGYFNNNNFYTLDIDLWHRILLYGKLYAQPNTLNAFRISDKSASVHVAKNQRRDCMNYYRSVYSNKVFRLSFFSYSVGILKTTILSFIKQRLYKFLS